MDNNRGFSLTELLVTIVILGIITAMSIPLIAAIKDANIKRKYSIYLDHLTYSSKLYVDSYQDDLFKYQETGCAYILFSDLKDKLFTKDIEIDNISCNSEDTFVKVVKLYDKYQYTPTMGCGEVKDGKVQVKFNYPTKIDKDSSCGHDVSKKMKFHIIPEESVAITKKKVNVNVKIESETGFNTQSKISYGFYKVDDSHPAKNYQYVSQWKTLSFDIPTKEEQLSLFERGDVFELSSKDFQTPDGETGKYQLVLRVDFLTDLAGVSWKSNDVSDYVYSEGLYTIDNTKPVISSFTAVSNKNDYNSLTPILNVVATDNDNYTLDDDLLACFSKDRDTCNKSVTAIKNYHKLSSIHNHMVREELSNDYDNSLHSLYITVADKAGNYTTKSVNYRVAQRYRINYDSNGGSICSPTFKDVIYNSDSIGTWGELCTPSISSHEFLGWNRRLDGTGETVTSNTLVSNNEKNITVYAQWNIHYLTIYYISDGSIYSATVQDTENVLLPNVKSIFAKDFYKADYWLNGSLSYSAGVNYAATRLASDAGCNLNHQNCSISLTPSWRETMVTMVFYCNGGHVVAGGKTPKNKDGWYDGIHSGVDYCDIKDPVPWSDTCTAASGIRDHNYNNHGGGVFNIEKKNCKPTDYWRIDSSNSKVMIKETQTYSNVLYLVDDIKNKGLNYLDDLKNNDISIKFYADFIC